MDLSIATDYACDHGDPSPYLRRIADAGFTHVHWCHCWCGDHLYSPDEDIAQIGNWLSEFGLRLLDLHGSIGETRNWASADEAVRQGGLELVRNRVDMTARLGGDAVVMHIPDVPSCPPLHRSLDELRTTCASAASGWPWRTASTRPCARSWMPTSRSTWDSATIPATATSTA
jgi:sugar phosphate isomerase/epimerase